MTEFANTMQSIKSAGLLNGYDGRILYNDVISVDNVLPKHSYRPFVKNECYSNSVKLLEKIKRDDAWYCEGYVSIENKYPIEHAWVIVGYTIIDPSLEMCQDIEALNKEEYYLLKKYTLQEVYSYLIKYKQYGPWWNRNFRKVA